MLYINLKRGSVMMLVDSDDDADDYVYDIYDVHDDDDDYGDDNDDDDDFKDVYDHAVFIGRCYCVSSDTASSGGTPCSCLSL